MKSFVHPTPVNSGRYGCVYKATTCDGKTIAVKRLPLHRQDLSHQKNLSMIEREYANWVILSGKPNILKLDGFVIDNEEKEALFISEYCSKGTLYDNLKTACLNKQAKLSTIRDILNAVSSCHYENIAHCDVKPANILLADNGDWKLCDFGCSQKTSSYESGLYARRGTPLFVAPEVFKDGDSYGKKVDIWAVGVIAFMLLYDGLSPFPQHDKQEFIKAVSQANITWPAHANVDEKDFIRMMLTVDPMVRATSDVVLQESFLKSI